MRMRGALALNRLDTHTQARVGRIRRVIDHPIAWLDPATHHHARALIANNGNRPHGDHALSVDQRHARPRAAVKHRAARQAEAAARIGRQGEGHLRERAGLERAVEIGRFELNQHRARLRIDGARAARERGGEVFPGYSGSASVADKPGCNCAE